MSGFVVHSIPGSPFGRAVLMTLEEKGAAYRLAPVAAGQFRAPEHLARHPFGKVPVLEYGDFSLYETQAILRYLERVIPEPALTPKDVRAAARMDQLMNINDWYLFQGVSNIICFQRVMRPVLMGMTPDLAAIAEAMPRAHEVFGELARQLGDRRYFTGEVISLADITIATQMDFFRGIPEWAELTDVHANLPAWLDRMNERPSMRATTWERMREMAQSV